MGSWVQRGDVPARTVAGPRLEQWPARPARQTMGLSLGTGGRFAPTETRTWQGPADGESCLEPPTGTAADRGPRHLAL